MGIDDLLNRIQVGSMIADRAHDYEFTGPGREMLNELARDATDNSALRIVKNKSGDFSVGVHRLAPANKSYVDLHNRRLTPSALVGGLTEREAKGLVVSLAENEKARNELMELLQKNQGSPQNLKPYLSDLITKGQEGLSQTPTKLLSPGNVSLPVDRSLKAADSAAQLYDMGWIKHRLEDTKFSENPGLKFSTAFDDKAAAGLPDIHYGDRSAAFKLGKPSLLNKLFGSGVAGSNVMADDAVTAAKNVIGGAGNSFRNYNLIQRAVDMRNAGSKFGNFLSKAYVPSKLLGMGGGAYANARALLGDDVSTTEKVLNGTGTLAATMPAMLTKARSASRTLDLIKNVGAKVKYGRLKALASVLPEAAVGASGFLPLLYGNKQAQ